MMRLTMSSAHQIALLRTFTLGNSRKNVSSLITCHNITDIMKSRKFESSDVSEIIVIDVSQFQCFPLLGVLALGLRKSCHFRSFVFHNLCVNSYIQIDTRRTWWNKYTTKSLFAKTAHFGNFIAMENSADHPGWFNQTNPRKMSGQYWTFKNCMVFISSAFATSLDDIGNWVKCIIMGQLS